jgi:arylsulfatase A-like enzyme
LAGLAAGCASPPPPPLPAAADPDRPNLLLVSIDTLRADHLGSYGYDRPTSPRLDAFAAGAVRYEQAYAPAPWTLPSHAAMLTGVHPYSQGFRHRNSSIPAAVPTAAELLATAGYRTAAFVDSNPKGYVGAERGFGRGFASYRHAPHGGGYSKYDMAATVDAALHWLGSGAAGAGDRSPFFLFLHTKSVHSAPLGEPCGDPRCFPYEKPAPYQLRFVDEAGAAMSWRSEELGDAQKHLWGLNKRFLDGRLDPGGYPRDRVEALAGYYDAGILYVDEHLGRLLDGLERLGLASGTAVVVTSDHGEAFLEHEMLLHQEVYEPLLHVPLLLRRPGQQAGETVPWPVALEDVAPTLLRLAGLEPPPVMTGRPLPALGPPADAAAADATAADRGPEPERSLFGYYLFPPNFSYQAYSLRAGRWKLVAHNLGRGGDFHYELYDLAEDPRERRPVTGEPAQLDRLERQLRAQLRRPPFAQAGGVDESDPALDAVRALGYID